MPSITLSALRSRVYDRLEENTAFYTSAEVNRAINEAILVLNLMTGFLQASGTVTTAANQVWYSTPSGILYPLRVALDGRALQRSGLRALSLSTPSWMLETSTNTGRPPEYWIPLGFTKFGINPADSSNGRTLTVTGISEAARLTADSDAITYPPEFGDAIEEYAAHVCQLKAGGAVAGNAMMAYQNFLKRVNRLKRLKGKISPQFHIDLKAPK